MLTLFDQQPREGQRAAAAYAALTRNVGQPGALDPRVADQWAGPTATLYNDLNTKTPVPDRQTFPDLPFETRYHDCFPAAHLNELERLTPLLPEGAPGPSDRANRQLL